MTVGSSWVDSTAVGMAVRTPEPSDSGAAVESLRFASRFARGRRFEGKCLLGAWIRGSASSGGIEISYHWGDGNVAGVALDDVFRVHTEARNFAVEQLNPRVRSNCEVGFGLGRIVALHHRYPLYTRFTNVFGASMFEATMRPHPRSARRRRFGSRTRSSRWPPARGATGSRVI